MSNEVEAEIIKNTQHALAKYIKKPPLTEKLLKKPPFRFLHDVVTNIVRETGFLKGLYTERELVSENVKDKDDKVAFLTKLIEATKTITGTDLSVRPTKIIAGLEVTETNLLLQAIASALDNNLDSSEYINQLKLEKKSKSKTHTKSQENEKKTKPDKTKEKSTTKARQEEKSKVASTPTGKNKQSRNADVTKKTTKRKPDKSTMSKGSPNEPEKESKTKHQTKKVPEKLPTPRENVVPKEQLNQNSININSGEENKQENNEEVDIKQNNQNLNKESKETLDVSNDVVVEQMEPKINYENNEPAVIQPKLTNAKEILKTEETSAEEFINILPPKQALERVKSAKPKSTRSKREKDVQNQNERLPLQVNNNIPQVESLEVNKPTNIAENTERPPVRPKSSLRPPSVRPSSARPGAPRLRNEVALPDGEVIPLGKVKVIVETFDNKEMDEEETVTIQTAPEPEFQPPTLQLPTDKGHLVEQILEQINQNDFVEHNKPAVNIEWEQDGLRSRNAANKEIEQLKVAIQTLTRTANPLGKLVNYLHEDVEAMQTELDMWTNSTRQIMVEIVNQKRISDESNKPLQMQLQEIEDSISKHQQEVTSIYGNILRNEQRIRDLLIK